MKKKTSNLKRLCAECLADTVKREQAKVIYFQESHKCDACTRTKVSVFVCLIYCPFEQTLNPTAASNGGRGANRQTA